MEIRGRSIVAGEVPPPGAGERFHALDPTRAVVVAPEFEAADTPDVDRACWAAWEGFHDLLSRRSRDRADLLDAIASGMESNSGELLARARVETGLPEVRLISERDRTLAHLRLFASIVREGSWVRASIDTGEPSRRPLPRPDLRRMLRPLGPIAVFGASNFPLAYSVAGGDTASALAAGCPVVVKGHPLHPGTGEIVARIVAEAAASLRFHPGIFSFLHSGPTRAHAIGETLVRHTCVRAVGFTGSFRGGMALERHAHDRPDPIPVFAEMGSTNPVFVLPGAMAEQAGAIAERLAGSITNSMGQMCTCPGLVFFVRSGEGEVMSRALGERLSGVAPLPMLAPSIADQYRRRLRELADVSGVEARAGSPEGAGPRASPALLRCNSGVFRVSPTLHDEVFGPACLLVVCESEGDLLDAASRVQGSLTASVWHASSDAPLLRRLDPVLAQRAGRLIYNGVPTGVEVAEAMVHAGPFPAATRPDASSVGGSAIERWCRPICFQNAPESILPPELRNSNPGGIRRRVNGQWESGAITRSPA